MTDTTPSSRIVAFVAAIAVVLATLFVPAGVAFADGEAGAEGTGASDSSEETSIGLWIGGVEVKKSGDSGKGWDFAIDGDTKTLMLKGFSGSEFGDRDAVIDYTGEDELKIVFDGDSTISGIKSDGEATAGVGIKSSGGQISISGEGNLVVTGGKQALGSSVKIDKELFVESGATSDVLKPVEDLYPTEKDDAVENAEKCIRISSKRRYAVTVTESTDKGTVTATPMRALAGEEVKLTASPKAGYRFLGFEVKGASESSVDVKTTDTSGTFTMPESDVVVSGTFVQIYKVVTKESTGGSISTGTVSEATEGETVRFTIKTNTGYVAKQLKVSPGGVAVDTKNNTFVMPAHDVELSVEFVKTANITSIKSTNGKVECEPKTNVPAGTKVKLTLTPNDGYKRGTLKVESNGTEIKVESDDTFVMPDTDVTVTAEFEKVPTYTVKVTAAGKGMGTWSASPSSGVEGTKVTLEAKAASGSKFSGWKIAKGEGAKLDGNTLTIGTSDVELTATFDVDDATDPSAIKSPVPKMATSRGGNLTSVSTTIAYRILQEVPADATYVGITFDLEPVMEYTSSASQVSVVISGTTTAINAAKVNIDGQRLTVVVDDASAVEALRGKTMSVTFNAKIKDGANLSSYLNSAGNVASVPYKATTVFKGAKDRTVQSTTEYVKFSVGSSGSSSGSGSSSSGSTAKSTTTTKAKETLAATGDSTSLYSLVCMAVAGSGVTLAGLRRKHAA